MGRLLAGRVVRFGSAVILAALSTAAWAQQNEGQRPRMGPQPHEFSRRVFILEHVEPSAAVTVLRTLIDARKVVMMTGPRPAVFMADTDEQLDAAADILEKIDVPPVIWIAELVMESASREEVIRTVHLQEQATAWQIGNREANILQIHLTPSVSATELRFLYDIEVQLQGIGGTSRLTVRESGQSTLRDGERLEVLNAVEEGHQLTLAEMLGRGGKARRLTLRVRSGG